jgi:hypothetical protein
MVQNFVFVVKNICKIPSNFIKCPNKSWFGFCPFYMNESSLNKVNGTFMLKKPPFNQPRQM